MEKAKSPLRKILDGTSGHYGWYYLSPLEEGEQLSGWKIHIFGEDINDSEVLSNALYGVLQQYNLPSKIATITNYKAGIGKIDDKQYGKAMTIYLPAQVFQPKLESESGLDEVLNSIKEALVKANYKKDHAISGDMKFSDSVYYRYEFSEVVDPKIGVGIVEYASLYRLNDGNFNIKNNPNPFIKDVE